ncbi:nucleoside-diphosphate kinase, partial [Candidatus Micrarchaeota archaeon]|nr:nucleoside-diphosphate kinase [Candidatus Micrarchaeota archaeon]
MMERTFVMFKPDAMQRGLVGKIMNRFEKKGLVPVAAKVVQLDDAMLKKHYAQYTDKPFFPRLCAFMKQSPVLCTVWEGAEAVKVVRDLLGPTNGRNAPAGTIRGDYSCSLQCNLVHASDSLETAKEETKRFFNEKEIVSWKRGLENYVYSEEER